MHSLCVPLERRRQRVVELADCELLEHLAQIQFQARLAEQIVGFLVPPITRGPKKEEVMVVLQPSPQENIQERFTEQTQKHFEDRSK